MDDILSDAIPESELATHPPEKAREHRVDETSLPKQLSKRLADASSPVQRTHVFVEIPPHPQHKRIPPSFPPIGETHCLSSSPKVTADVVETLENHESIFSKRLPPRFHPCLDAQKNAILRNLRDTSKLFDSLSSDSTSIKQLEDLLMGTISRSEGNSCLLLGPRGSGKSKVPVQFYMY
jgi:origin recognition complex subunit 4